MSLVQLIRLFIRRKEPLVQKSALQRTSVYWIWRQKFKNTQLSILGKFFTAKEKIKSASESVGILRIIFNTIAGAFIFAILVVSLTAGIEYLVLHKTTWIPEDWRKIIHLRGDAYISLISTMAQVAGVFLGLYFTAVSAVASAAYAKVPGSVRALVLEEKMGNIYVRLVAFEGATATLLLTFYALGIFLGYGNLVIVGIGGVLAIFAFVVLGFRVFDFFDATQLLGFIARDIRRAITGATPSGTGWSNEAIQRYQQHRAETALDGFRDLIVVASQDENLEKRSLIHLAKSLCDALTRYAAEKQRIPLVSYWFKREYRHRNWQSAGFGQIEVALHTGTNLQPEVVPDHRWLEKAIEGNLCLILKELDEANDVERVVKIALCSQKTIAVMAFHSPSNAFAFFKALAPKMRIAYRNTIITGSEAPQLQKNSLSLVDVCFRSLIEIILKVSLRVEDLREEKFIEVFIGDGANKSSSMYDARWPMEILHEAERLQIELANEQKVEGTSSLPLWYALERWRHGFLKYICNAVSLLVEILELEFIPETKALIAEEKHLLGAQLVQVGLEYCDKLMHHLAGIQEHFVKAAQIQSSDGLKWPNVEWASFATRIEAARETLLSTLADSALPLAPLSTADYPDYLGQLYSMLAQTCYDALAKGAEERFTRLFPKFFALAFLTPQRTQQQAKGANQIRVDLILDPITDLMELSGFALIYSALDAKPYDTIVRQLWDNRMRPPAGGSEASFITAFIQLIRPMAPMMPRSLIRTAWKQHLEQIMRARGILQDEYLIPFQANRPSHPSPLIRALTQVGTMTLDGAHVFAVEYLLKKPDATGIQVSDWRIRDFRAALDRENQGTPLPEE